MFTKHSESVAGIMPLSALVETAGWVGLRLVVVVVMLLLVLF